MRRGRGFTLLEMMVVLVIVSLLMTVLTQALWMGLDLLRRARGDMTAQAVETMRLGWYREAVAGLLPERPGGPHRFAGEGRRFAGLSAGAPVEHLGATLPLRVELEYEAAADRTRLLGFVAGTEAPMTLLSWPGRAGEFAYLDEAGESHQSWPPPFGEPLQLPRAIVLKAGLEHSGPLLVYTAIEGDRRTPVGLDQVMGGGLAAPR
jgi:general secretion pathway protein J